MGPLAWSPLPRCAAHHSARWQRPRHVRRREGSPRPRAGGGAALIPPSPPPLPGRLPAAPERGPSSPSPATSLLARGDSVEEASHLLCLVAPFCGLPGPHTGKQLMCLPLRPGCPCGTLVSVPLQVLHVPWPGPGRVGHVRGRVGRLRPESGSRPKDKKGRHLWKWFIRGAALHSAAHAPHLWSTRQPHRLG